MDADSSGEEVVIKVSTLLWWINGKLRYPKGNYYYLLSGYLAIADKKTIYYHKAKRTMDRGGT